MVASFRSRGLSNANHSACSGVGNSSSMGPGVIRPILLALISVNHSLPSGPGAMPKGALVAVGTGNSVMAPAGVMRPIWLPSYSVNHRLPSGPGAMP